MGMDAAQISTRLTSIEDRQRSLQGELEETQHALEQLLQEIEKLKADIDLRFSEIQSALDAVKRVRKGTPNQLLQDDTKNPSDQHESNAAALEDADTAHPLEKARTLFNVHRYEEAQRVLESYVAKKLAKSDLAVAQYWLGEVFFAQKRYQEAALAFVTGYKADAHGRRTPETLLKLARSLVAVKKTKEARTTLRKLLQDYPDAAAEIREKAQELLKKTI
jgi:tol-pal system protein YbgF